MSEDMDPLAQVWPFLDAWRASYDRRVWRRVLRDVDPRVVGRLVAEWTGSHAPRPGEIRTLALAATEAPEVVVPGTRTRFGLRDVEYVLILGRSLGGDEGREYVDEFWRSVAAGVTVVRPEVRAKYGRQIRAAAQGLQSTAVMAGKEPA